MGSDHRPRSYQERALPLSQVPPRKTEAYFTIHLMNGQDPLI